MYSKWTTRSKIMVRAIIAQPPDAIRIPLAITEAAAAAAAAATPPAAGAAATPAVVTVAMTPHVVTNNVINYSTKARSVLYKAASKGLFSDTEQDKYDLSPKGLLTFLDDFGVQADECGWLANKLSEVVEHHC
jgi:hypothetical protein